MRGGAERGERRGILAGACPVFARADACRSRFCLLFAVSCRAGVHARRRGWRRRTGSRRAKSPALPCDVHGVTEPGGGSPPHLCVGADACIGPPAGLADGWRLCVAARSRRFCRAGVHARRLGPCGSARVPGRCQHRPLRMWGKVLPGLAGYLRRKPAMHPSVCALRRIHLPCKGRCRPRRRRGAAPCRANILPGGAQIFPAGVNARRGSLRRQTGLRRAKSPALPFPVPPPVCRVL